MSFPQSNFPSSGARSSHAGDRPRGAPKRLLSEASGLLAQLPWRNWGRALVGSGHALAWLAGLGALVLLLVWVARQQVLGMPVRQHPAQIRLHLEPALSVVLGREALAAREADEQHVEFSVNPEGTWSLRNVSDTRKLLVTVGLDAQGRLLEVGNASRDAASVVETDTRTVRLEQGARVLLGHQLWTVSSLTPESITLTDEQQRQWRYDGTRVQRLGHAGTPPAVCVGAPSSERWAQRWNEWMPLARLRLARAMVLGGGAECGERVAVDGAEWDTARVSFQPQRGFVLSPGSAPRAAAQVRLLGSDEALLVQDAAARLNASDLVRRSYVELAEVQSMVVGRTHYKVSFDGLYTLVLEPTRRVAWTGDKPPAVDGLTWVLDSRSAWQWPAGGIPGLALALGGAGVAVAVAAFLLALRRQRLGTHMGVLWRTAAGVTLAVLAVAALRSGAALGVGWVWGLASAGLLTWLLGQRRRWVLGTAASLLLAAGLATQMDLALAAPHTQALQDFTGMAGLLVLGFGVLLLLQGLVQGLPTLLPRWGRIDTVLLAVAALAGMGLGVQTLLGDEAGVFGVQPVEFAKLALIFVGAHVLAMRAAWADHPTRLAAWAIWLRVLAPVLLLLALVALALVLLHDFSPLVLLGFWTVGLGAAYSVARGHAWVGLVMLGLLVAGLLGVVAHPQHVAEALQALGLYGDRMQVWLAPELHPFTGEQLRRAHTLAAQGGIWGTWDVEAARLLPWRVPAVKDDFAASFFLARCGRAGAAALVVLQLTLVAALLDAGLQRLSLARSGDYLVAWWTRASAFVLWGGALLLAGHFVVSWGTNLGLLPVMGQPMSGLSMGGSHWTFLFLPLLGFAVLAGDAGPRESA